MKKCMIEVIKTTYDEDLGMDYGVPGPCPMHHVGQVFYADYAKPEGFCDEAWKAIYQYVFALAHMEKGAVLYGDWIQIPGVSINSCNDGIRTVVFKITRMDDPDTQGGKEAGFLKNLAKQKEADRQLERPLMRSEAGERSRGSADPEAGEE